MWKYHCSGMNHFEEVSSFLALQLLPLLYSIKLHNAKLQRSGFDLNMCYFYFSFNRKLHKHINHKMLKTSDIIMQQNSNYTQLYVDKGCSLIVYPCLERHLGAIAVPCIQEDTLSHLINLKSRLYKMLQ